jgi:hypothetical protein
MVVAKWSPPGSRQEDRAVPVDLRALFLHLQDQLLAHFQTNREILRHPGAKGTATEERWREMLATYLPKRYCVSKAFVIDADGQQSDEIDLVIYDQQYSPFLFKQDQAVFIPAESVYAVLEVKQTLTAEHVRYAIEKAASVRELRRTSAAITHVLGTTRPTRPPFEVLAGVLCLESSWSPPFGKAFVESLERGSPSGHLDLICALRHGTVEVTYSGQEDPVLDVGSPDTALIFFFLRLLEKLQGLGTVPAMDLREYGKALAK